MSMQSPRGSDSPAEQEASPLRRRTIVVWLVAIGAAVLLVPLYLIFATIRSDTARLEARTTVLQQTLESPDTPVPANEELLSNLAETEERLEQLNEAVANLEAQNVDWPAVMKAIGGYNPAQMALSSVETGSSITLRGRAIDDTVVVDYSRDLEESGLFSRVVVQSLQAIATPFATSPAGTPVPTATAVPVVTPTATVTSPVGFVDQYEVDDFRPVPIALGVPQERAFHPLFDVDRVKFLVKAGRYYRIATDDLAPGVDTYLTVDIGSRRYTNDDRGPGVYASELVIQGGAQDMEAFVRVTNRGQYGPDMRYELLVEEVIPTPIPTPTGTALPPPPTETPVPTPDPRDEYEPDDISPNPIAIGETQLHNFVPEGDVDTVSFLAKAGRWYRVSTSGLAEGVDTHLAVILNDTVYRNDDRAPAELSSEVVFQGLNQDVQALVKITNRGQFGEERTYNVSVQEILPTPTPSPIPTATDTPVPESSPTPDLRDPYEPDDAAPNPIALGETQTHNFYPEGDVDRVEFLAKSERWYRVATSELSEKADTVLEVTLTLGATTVYTYRNDDQGPGDLSSEIVFRVEPDQDVNAEVKITNRDQYGPQQTYNVTVEEVFPDLMSIGETEQRAFTLRATDQVQFAPKVNRRYVITTSQLALGVDTRLQVYMDGELVGENDDYLPGSYASRVEFVAPSSNRAVVMITNLQDQYGPDKTYQISIDEIPVASWPSGKGPGLSALALPEAADDRPRRHGGGLRQHRPSVRLEPVWKPPNAEAVEFVIVLELAR